MVGTNIVDLLASSSTSSEPIFDDKTLKLVPIAMNTAEKEEQKIHKNLGLQPIKSDRLILKTTDIVDIYGGDESLVSPELEQFMIENSIYFVDGENMRAHFEGVKELSANVMHSSEKMKNVHTTMDSMSFLLDEYREKFGPLTPLD
ncbi:hypothetical protein Zmor_008763 [Zophobas morio]|uniref:Uncharacterized protein n=1 Tax=Zophobas morio TaxID=2755281 RepID=A0AA38HJR9_9CUCU|nr:hypothetical protein Zmor_008763 [Zophobas morio]